MNPILCAICGATVLAAQVPVAKQLSLTAGARGDIVLNIASSGVGYVVDVLSTDAALKITMVLPDGQEVTAQNSRQLGFRWRTGSSAQVRAANPNIVSLLPSGEGQHTLIFLEQPSIAGDFRLNFDGSGLENSTRISALPIPLARLLTAALQALPGTAIVGPTKIAAGSAQTMQLPLKPASDGGLMDIVVADRLVQVTVEYPDGTRLTQGNAKAAGVEWDVTTYPPQTTGIEGLFVDAALRAILLPVEGIHHMVILDKVSLGGNYIVRLDATRSNKSTEASVMFLPTQAARMAGEDVLGSILPLSPR